MKEVIPLQSTKLKRATIPSLLSNVKVVSIGDVTRDDSQGRFLAQCNVAAMLRRYVALKTVVANLPV